MSSSARSSLTAISMWHSRLGHISLLIIQTFLSFLSIYFPEDHLCSFSCNSYNITKRHKLPFTKSSITSPVYLLPLRLMSSFLMRGPHPFPLLMVFITTLFLLTISQSIYDFIHYVINQTFIQHLLPSNNLLKIISPPPLKHFNTLNYTLLVL